MRWDVGALVCAIAAVVSMQFAGAQGRPFHPVTDAMVSNPSADDWLAWRGTTKSLGYSPLTQVNRTNVRQLQLAWSWAMDPGSQEVAPIVHDGIMYLHGPGALVVQALDAATGELLWEYQHQLPEQMRQRAAGAGLRGISIYDDKIFVNTFDAQLVALDARTGTVVWQVQVADPNLGFGFGAGAVIANGKVVSALTGCARRFVEEKCAIVAHDARTGKEVWRLRTIPVKGEPGDETWGDVEPIFRVGTDMWITGSYDPELNLVYWSTSQPKPWAAAARGTNGVALYSNSTLAINPDTGTIVWYHQFIPNDSHDMDEVFENILVDIGTRKSLFKMGKLGILWELDRTTGKFLGATDLGYQTLVRLDQATGKAVEIPERIPKLNETLEFCPALSGIKSWRAMAFSPETQAFYIPASLTCWTGVFTAVAKVAGGPAGTGGGRSTISIHPNAGGNLGEFIALSVSGKVLWKKRQRAPYNSAALTTGGGLVFIGDWDRYVHAYDVKTGELLWQTRTPTSVQGFPISYAVNGRQYVAVPVGVGGASWGTAVPMTLARELKRPSAGMNAMMVFALPRVSPSSSRRSVP